MLWELRLGTPNPNTPLADFDEPDSAYLGQPSNHLLYQEQLLTTLIGFDYGTKRIGVAVGQTLTSTASPLVTLHNKGSQPDWQGIERLIRTWQPQALVVGFPFNMDDTEADPAPRMKRFSHQLEARFGLPVHLADERLTSIESRRQLGAAPTGPVPELDSYAAKLILETWLCEHSNL